MKEKGGRKTKESGLEKKEKLGEIVPTIEI